MAYVLQNCAVHLQTVQARAGPVPVFPQGSELLVSHEWSIKNSNPQFQTVKWQAARFHTLDFYLLWDLREKYKFAGKVEKYIINYTELIRFISLGI